MSNSGGREIVSLAALAFAALASSAPAALADVSRVRTKGVGAFASFTSEVQQVCPGSPVPVPLQTSVLVQINETTTRTAGSQTNALVTFVDVNRIGGCASEFVFESRQFDTGSVTVKALSSARIVGQFALDTVTLSVDLVLSSTGVTETGSRMVRSNIGNTLLIERSTGSSADATIAGTIFLNAQAIPISSLISSDAEISRTTLGEITILKP